MLKIKWRTNGRIMISTHFIVKRVLLTTLQVAIFYYLYYLSTTSSHDHQTSSHHQWTSSRHHWTSSNTASHLHWSTTINIHYGTNTVHSIITRTWRIVWWGGRHEPVDSWTDTAAAGSVSRVQGQFQSVRLEEISYLANCGGGNVEKGLYNNMGRLWNKFRNMKQTFKNIADNNSKTGRGRKHWDYFDIFKDLFADCATVTLDNVSETQVSWCWRWTPRWTQHGRKTTCTNTTNPTYCQKKKKRQAPQGRFRAD